MSARELVYLSAPTQIQVNEIFWSLKSRLGQTNKSFVWKKKRKEKKNLGPTGREGDASEVGLWWISADKRKQEQQIPWGRVGFHALSLPARKSIQNAAPLILPFRPGFVGPATWRKGGKSDKQTKTKTNKMPPSFSPICYRKECVRTNTQSRQQHHTTNLWMSLLVSVC